jgi:hypothetical protein
MEELRELVHTSAREPCKGSTMYEVVVMQDQQRVDEKASDAELIALWCKTQDEIEVHGALDELNELLSDFAMQLLRQRLLA